MEQGKLGKMEGPGSKAGGFPGNYPMPPSKAQAERHVTRTRPPLGIFSESSTVKVAQGISGDV